MAADGFRHQALFYSGDEEFLAGTLPFIRDAVAADEPIMVAVGADKIKLLRSRLNGAADRVAFADMHEIGRNPALIIPAWQDFVTATATRGQRARGIGEPTCAPRSAAEVAECEHHESLLNLAFDHGPSWWLLCPYDVGALGPAVVAGAEHNHPFIEEHGVERRSGAYREPAATGAPFSGRLPAPSVAPEEMVFEAADDLEATRRFVTEQAAAEEMDSERADGLVLAVDEVVTNALRHGGGRGVVRVWPEGGGLVCEVSDTGTITDPMVGRIRPDVNELGSRGLWIANNFCDLVQIRSSRAGTVVRCHLGAAESAVRA